MTNDYTQHFQQQLLDHRQQSKNLYIQGGRSKQHLHPPIPSDGAIIDTTAHQGIVNYHPSELIVTVRSGSNLEEIQQHLAQHNQRFSFDPPQFSPQTTIGGMVATGINGSSRPWSGLIRDCILGVKLINGKGEIMRFGGEVFKNVAGFDLFRPHAGAWGTLGLITEITFRTNPQPQTTSYHQAPISADRFLKLATQLKKHPLSITGMCWYQQQLYLRLEGFSSAVKQTIAQVQKTVAINQQPDTEQTFWQPFNQYQLSLFKKANLKQSNLYRQIVPNNQNLHPNPLLIDWAGSLRWYDNPPNHSSNTEHTGHYQSWNQKFSQTQQLPPNILQLNQRIRQAFDPDQIINQHIIIN